jgi:putative Mg2+ transporter-C (MgtC) family protein
MTRRYGCWAETGGDRQRDRHHLRQKAAWIARRAASRRAVAVRAPAVAGAAVGGLLAWASRPADPFVIVLGAGAAGAVGGYVAGDRGWRGATTMRLLLAAYYIVAGIHHPDSLGVTMAAFGLILGVLALVAARRTEHAEALRATLRINVRRSDGRTVAVDVPAAASARYATRRAAQALEDPRNCVLARAGQALRPGRSLLANGVRHGDTLELLAAPATIRRMRTPSASSTPRMIAAATASSATAPASTAAHVDPTATARAERNRRPPARLIVDPVTWLDFAARLACAVALGASIGSERQWRQRLAGLRTNCLVAAGAAQFVLLSAMTPGDTSPTRIAAQVVSGIGFLGAGVILRDGLNIRGLNTAATLWCSAAVGCLAGAGLLVEATIGTAAVIAANVLLRPLGRKIDRQPVAETELETAYRFRVRCADAKEAHVRALLLQALAGGNLMLQSLHSYDVDETGYVAVHADLIAPNGRDDPRVEQAASRLSLESGVTGVSWEILDVDEAFQERALRDARP